MFPKPGEFFLAVRLRRPIIYHIIIKIVILDIFLVKISIELISSSTWPKSMNCK
jgi:hypothetical protein